MPRRTDGSGPGAPGVRIACVAEVGPVPAEQPTGLLGRAPLVLSLLLDGPLGQGFRLEPLVRDR